MSAAAQVVVGDDLGPTGKPPYRVPLMAEIAALPWNGFTVASTFSGCGGSSLGYRMAGFRVAWASEFVEAARDTYRANASPSTIIDDRDIREVSAEDVLDALGMARGDLDLLDGSPPCASFSTAGKRNKGWGKVKTYSDREQRSDDLFFEFARLVDGIQPRTFVAENVSGLVKGKAKGYFLAILRALTDCGYKVEARMLDAQWLGVPQSRQRLIFVGVRDDLGLAPAFPTPLPYRYSVREALPWIASFRNPVTLSGFGHGEMKERIDQPAQTVKVAGIGGADVYEVEESALVLGGGNCAPNKPGNSFPRNVRVDLDGPVPTIMAAPEIIGSAPHELQVKPSLVRRNGNPNHRGGVSITDLDREPCPTITACGIGAGSYSVEQVGQRIAKADVVPDNVGASMDGYAVGKEWDRLGPGEKSDRFFSLVKPDADRPCPTITGSGGTNSIAGVTHPTERRKFTIAELRRLGGFPDDFVLTGTYAQQWERIGRAVPPVMMAHIAAAIRDGVLRKVER